MSRTLVAGMVITQLACTPLFQGENKKDAAEVAREDAARAEGQQRWSAEESRRLLALCLDIAKFEKQWANYASWSFDYSAGTCTVEYKSPASEKKSVKECKELWLAGEGLPKTKLNRRFYSECVENHFSRDWDVRSE